MASSRNHAMTRRAAGLALLALVGACRGASAPPSTLTPATSASVAMVPLVGRAFGDTAIFGTRVLAFDRDQELATATVRTAAYVTVLAIIPGRDIEIVLPRPSEPVRKVKAGTVSLALHRLADIDHAVDEAEDTRRMREFDACMARERAASARKPPTRTSRVDSTGKPIYDRRDASTTADDMSQAEARCSRARSTTRRAQDMPRKRLPVRAPADRYLVVLTSSMPLSELDLNERLASLSTVAQDVSTAIEAVAAGLFVGHPGTWAGYYVSW